MRSKQFMSAFLVALAVVAMIFASATSLGAAPKYKVLHAFTGGKDGGGLWGSLLLDKQGNLYGTTALNTVFELTPHPDGRWSLKVLHVFNGNDGAGPSGGLLFDGAGNLYGTTTGGGAHGYGTVFEMVPDRSGWDEQVLYSFPQPPSRHGCCPNAGLVMDQAGHLYGTAGYPFVLIRDSNGWKETVLHFFTCRNNDGCVDLAGVILDASGNLYGTTEGGGANKAGTVYRLRHTAAGWKEQLLHNFPAFSNDGQVPGVGALIQDGSGALYGTTNQGGSNLCVDVGCGTIFKLARDSSGRWQETILYDFTGSANGSGPGGGVVMDKAGNLYGTTVYGGTSSCQCGVVYMLAAQSDGTWKYTVLHRFTGYDGAQPDANLIIDDKGNL
jgi:uncharacterized repeat protein (TIGR03803 family)